MNNASKENTLRVIVHLRDKTTKEFTEDVCKSSGDNIDMKSLSLNLLSLQTKVNNFLTDLVEQEKSIQVNPERNDNQVMQDDDDEEEDDDVEEDDNEPPMKQQKT